MRGEQTDEYLFYIIFFLEEKSSSLSYFLWKILQNTEYRND